MGAFGSLLPAEAANANPGQVIHIRFVGPMGDAAWDTGPGPNATSTLVLAEPSQLIVDQATGTEDTDGVITNGTDTSADVTSGFSFTIDKAQLTTASLSASGIPATSCAIDGIGNDTNCTPTTIDLTVAWTSLGPIQHVTTQNLHQSFGDTIENLHMNGTLRLGNAIGTFDRSVLVNNIPADNGALAFTNVESMAQICRGIAC